MNRIHTDDCMLSLRPLKEKYQEVAKSVYLRSSSGEENKRKQQADLEEKVNGLYSNIKLFEKSLRVIIGKYRQR